MKPQYSYLTKSTARDEKKTDLGLEIMGALGGYHRSNIAGEPIWLSLYFKNCIV